MNAGNVHGMHAHEVAAPRSGDGVDLSLIDWMLSLSPDERLQALQDQVDLIASAQRAATD